MAAINPFAYYRMSNLNVGTQTVTDAFGYANLVGTGGNVYSATNEFNQVVLRLSSDTASLVASSSTLKIINSFSVEFTVRINNHKFHGGQVVSIDNGSMSIYLEPYVSSSVPIFYLYTKHGPLSSDERPSAFSFNKMNRENYRYISDGNTHHFVFTYDSTTGIKKLYIDGQNPQNFSATTSLTGNLYAPGTNHNIRVHSNTSYRKFMADFNHLALYDAVLTDNQIYQHYLDIMSGNNYSFTENVTTPTIESSAGVYNAYDFAPGTDFNTDGLTQGVSVDQLIQLQKFPLPRYKSGHTLLRLYNWFTVDYISQSGGITTGPTPSLVSFARSLMIEFFTNWFYYLPVAHNQDPTAAEVANTTGHWSGMLCKLANENPNIPTQHTILRIQLGGNLLYSKTNANNYYLQNSSNQFLDVNGNITVVQGSKVWRPLEANLSYYRTDGDIVKSTFNNVILPALSGRTTPRVNIINENAEIVPPLTNSVLNLDTTFVTERNAAGYSSSNSYFGRVYKKVMRDNYADVFITASTLSGVAYTEYAVIGMTDFEDEPQYTKKWSETRLINTPFNGQYYSTGDFYPRYPYNWRNWISSWHGLQWFIQAKNEELTYGDSLMSPFIAAGWDIDERNNIRPAQWLGLLKVLGAMGSEFFYTGLFNESAPFPNPKNYVWQMAAPAYAQAITSRYEDILRNGELLDGDYPRAYDPPQTNGPGFHFYTGDLRKFCTVRKHNSKGEYIIAATLNPVNNYSGGCEESSIATIYLDGVNPFKFNVRRQGSVYFYQSGATPVFYQLDDWHESTHPYYWDNDIKISAPLYDSSEYIPIKTEKTGGTYDFTAFTSYVSFSSATNIEYVVSPRSAVTHYFWVKARSVDGTSTGLSVKMNNGTSYPIGCIKATDWRWYRRQSSATTAISFTMSAGSNTMTVTSNNNKLEISDFHITSSSATLYQEGSLTAIGLPPTVVSSGGTVVLSAATGSSYLWFPSGETTQVITAITSGAYYVQIDDGAGCTATTNSIDVVVTNDEFLTNIQANGPTTFSPGGNVELSGSTLYYLGAPTTFAFEWYYATSLVVPYELVGTGATYTASSTGYYYVDATSSNTNTTLSSSTIYVNANASGPPIGETTESIIDYPLIYSSSVLNMPWESDTFTLLDTLIFEYFVFVRIRSDNGSETGVKVSLDGGINFASVTNCVNTSFGWYRIGVLHAGYRNQLNDYVTSRTVMFQANNNHLIMDSYIVSQYANTIPGPYPNTQY